MSHTPLEWHLHPGAQALIRLIAEAGHQPKTRSYKNPISSHRSPQWIEAEIARRGLGVAA